jgi:predicted nuclease of predicted toxin-antitoxin system
MVARTSKSKKRSAVNSPARPPEPLAFFIDRSLGKKVIAEVLRQEGAEVHVHDDLFPPDTPDEEWLGEIGRRRWIVLTKDLRIRYRTSERLAVQQAGVAMFALTAGDCQGKEMAVIFAKALPRITRFLRINTPPFIATIARSGAVSMLVDLK